MSAHDIETHSNANAQNLYESLQVISKLFSASVDEAAVAVSNSSLETMPTPLLPNVTLPDFEAFAMAARNSTGALLIAYAPLIAAASVRESASLSSLIGSEATLVAAATAAGEGERLAWEQYALGHADWILRGHLFHPDTSALFATTTATDAATENLTVTELLQQQHQAQKVVLASIMAPIPAKIWRYNPTTSIDEVEMGVPPYSPAWQLSPPPYDSSIVNFNYASRIAYAKLVAATLGETMPPGQHNAKQETRRMSSNSKQQQQQQQPIWQEKQMLLSEPFDTRLLYGNALPKNPSDQNYKSVYDLPTVPTVDDETTPVDGSTTTTDTTTPTTTTPEYVWDGQEPLASPQSIIVLPVVASLIGSTGLGSVGSQDKSQNPYNVVAGHISAAIPWTTVIFANVRMNDGV
jgi:hypothetical protein